MTAFKDLWQEQRRLRQEEVALRKQQVRDTLTSFEQDRQTMASQLRDDLNLFQVELQHETQVFLATVSKQRQVKAEQVSQLLRDFVQVLQSQTAEFLAASAADRFLMAEQLFQDLSQFHARLITSVATLRQTLQARMQEIQAEVQLLQAETQEMLIVNREQRIQVRQQLVQELAAFVESLRGDVQSYLSELELVRQDRAQRLHQMLQLDRERRLSEVEAMFHELTEFRAELRQYCVNLRSLVWGGGEPQVESVKPQATQSKLQPRVTPATAAPKPIATVPPQARLVTSRSQPIAVSTVQPARATQPVATKAPVASAPTPLVIPQSVVPTPAAPVPVASEPVPQPVVEAPVAAQPMATQPEVVPVATQTSPKPVQLDPAELEKEIYNHIHHVQGARLTELESDLRINRFQAVDALRALIKKGLITQRDRIYLIQEEVSL